MNVHPMPTFPNAPSAVPDLAPNQDRSVAATTEIRQFMAPFRDGWTKQDIEAAVARGLPEELLYVPIVIGMDPPDCGWAEAICLSLVGHPDFNVRSNAVLGLGHLARTCRRLDLAAAVTAIAAGLHDENAHVRGQADNAADDLLHYLGVRVPGHVP
ncbi:hypothetical protein [Lysobacter sp. Hz 25]|uniref:hypothetical protein n=1 Tax=Lysobacter sp. Hz 25 TaxID=3383698 RepID=UPI0038D40BF6